MKKNLKKELMLLTYRPTAFRLVSAQRRLCEVTSLAAGVLCTLSCVLLKDKKFSAGSVHIVLSPGRFYIFPGREPTESKAWSH